MIRLGNDVVDLRDPRCRGKASDDRFVDRVFTAEEAGSIRSASVPDRALWIRWAAKEAGFKVASKLLGSPPPFEHAAFRVRLASEAGPDAPATGRVRYRDLQVPVSVEAGPDRIDALARYREDGEAEAPVHRDLVLLPERMSDRSSGWEEDVRERFTDREWRSVHGPASALVRIRARTHLARVLDVGEDELEIVCDEGPPGRTPPRIVLRGREHPGDLTLSHHGRFLAWAFSVPAERGPPARDRP